jgi:hypothetical protein
MNRSLALLASMLLAQSVGYSQSLGAVAEKERERRKKNDAPVRVVDEAGLRQAEGSGGIMESSVSTSSKEDEGRSDSKPSASPIARSSSRECDGIKRSLVDAERRYKEPVTYTYRVPGRIARGVITGTNSNGEFTRSDVQTYEDVTKRVYCTSKEGMSVSECWRRKSEVDTIRMELLQCR